MPAKPTILVFCRPFLVDSYRANAAPLAAAFRFEFLTDGASPGTPDTRAAFYANLRGGTRCAELSADAEADVVARCRLLRNLAPAMASRLAHAMAAALADALDRIRPAGVFTQMVDDYSGHLLWLLSAARGLGYLGYCAGYFPGTSLLLADAHGRPFECREPGLAEAEAALDLVSQRAFRQTYNLGADYRFGRHLFQLARYRAKRLVFAVRARRQRDPWNSHYAQTPFIAERRRLRDFPYRAYFHRDWQSALAAERARRPHARIVYIPLGYFPEATIDYWIVDKRALRYEPLILDMVATLARDCIVVVKEHLHMMGARPAAFLKALRAIEGAVSVHPLELSNAVVDASDAVVVGGGSPGIEATVRGKPVLSFCDTSYWFAPSGAERLDLGAIAGWHAQIEARIQAFEPPERARLLDFMTRCLRASTRTDPVVTYWPLLDPDDLRLALSKVASLRPAAA